MSPENLADVLSDLEKLASAHTLDAQLLSIEPDKTPTDRDRYVAHEASAASFQLAIDLIRLRLDGEPT